MQALIALAVLFTAYANGANDNFKGVATLFGSKTTSYKVALALATATTFAGATAAIVVAPSLFKTFSGAGLVSKDVAGTQIFQLSVAAAAGLTVMLATLLGFPVSTTHGLTGALAGAGLVAVGSAFNWGELTHSFFLPILVSPLIAVGGAFIVGALSRFLARRRAKAGDWCVCVGETHQVIPVVQGSSVAALGGWKLIAISMGDAAMCDAGLTGGVARLTGRRVTDVAHYLSAGAVSFSRGLNDTPKIAALFPIIALGGLQPSTLVLALLMAVGGLLSARKVAHVMSQRVTSITSETGLVANGVTASLVVVASRLGLPVSTTHVSVGSLFGIGTAGQTLNGRVALEILGAWVLTLPVAALFGAGLYWVQTR